MAMVERNPALTFVTHLVLVIGVIVVMFPIYVIFVASSNSLADILDAPMPILPGALLIKNYVQAILQGAQSFGASASLMLMNSVIMALGISLGKIAISLFAAFAIVYFRFPLRQFFFWTIFLTLMLPVEVRILPTYQVVASLGLLDSYAGLTLPIIASATATFLLRQFFMTVPDELAEAATLDGATPMQYFWRVLMPISRTTIAALFVILFIFGWNQYLWGPLRNDITPCLSASTACFLWEISRRNGRSSWQPPCSPCCRRFWLWCLCNGFSSAV